jgi:hypothetical protein
MQLQGGKPIGLWLSTQINVQYSPSLKRKHPSNTKRHPDKIFITENLTQYRTNLVKALAELKYSRKIHAYWTTDGRIYLKTNENSRKILYQGLYLIINGLRLYFCLMVKGYVNLPIHKHLR